MKRIPLHGNRNFDKQYYQRFHKEYDREEFNLYCRWFKGWLQFLDHHLPLINGRAKKVLEIGCSIGAFTKLLRDRNFDVIATDISAFIIKKAADLQKDATFKILDVEKEINIPGTFDYIFAFEVMEHLKNPEKSLMHIRKKLKKGGIFVFSTPFPTKRSLADPTHINVHTPDWWIAAGKAAGYKNRKLIYATFIPYFYRYSSFFSFGMPFKSNIPYVNSTCILIFNNE